MKKQDIQMMNLYMNNMLTFNETFILFIYKLNHLQSDVSM